MHGHLKLKFIVEGIDRTGFIFRKPESKRSFIPVNRDSLNRPL